MIDIIFYVMQVLSGNLTCTLISALGHPHFDQKAYLPTPYLVGNVIPQCTYFIILAIPAERHKKNVKLLP